MADTKTFMRKRWRTEVLQKSNNQCIVCKAQGYNNVGKVMTGHRDTGTQKPKLLNCHHLLPRQFTEFQYHVDNGVALCCRHHTLGRFSAHKNAIWFSEWVHENLPELWEKVKLRYKLYPSIK